MISVLGAGSMGCLWAAYLSHSQDIQFISTRSTTVAEKRFALTGPHNDSVRTYIIPVKSRETITHPIETLLVCTKSYDTKSALADLKANISLETIIVLFQNGLGSQHAILEQFPDNAIFAAVTTEAVYRQSAEMIVHAGTGSTSIGILNKLEISARNTQNLLDACLGHLGKSELIIEKKDDIWKYLWEKLAINCAINPFTAIINCPNGEIKQHDLFKLKWPSLRKELAQLLELEDHPITEEELEHTVFNVIRTSRNNISSMLQDIRNMRMTEIDDINGFAALRLKTNGAQYKANQELWQGVVELQTNYLS